MVYFSIMGNATLTSNQRHVLAFIIKDKAKNGSTPSLQEIQAHFGFKAIGTVQDYLKVLEKKGYIQRSSKARDIEILDNAGIEAPDKETVRLPIVGQVAAGSPILAEENLEGHMRVDRSIVRSKDAFLLRVRGTSMINAHIMDGDMVVVTPQRTCEDGEIAVCLIDGEATVKRFYKRKRYIELKPENDSMEPIIVKKDEPFYLAGRVVGVLRSFNN